MWGLQQFNCLVLPDEPGLLAFEYPGKLGGLPVSQSVSCVSLDGKEIEQPQGVGENGMELLYLDDLRG